MGVFLVISLNSCENVLEEKPRSFVLPEHYFSNKAECTAAVNYVYSVSYGFYRVALLYVTDLTTDLAYFNGHTDPAVYFALSPSSPGTSAVAIWTHGYRGVVHANNVLSRLEKAPIDNETKGRLMGETSFLRAFYYYILTSSFGDVPFFFDTVMTFEDQDRIKNIPRMDAIETRKTLIADLSQYVDSLPVKQPTESNQRVTRQAAYMLLAKMEMFNNNFEAAIPYLERVREIYGKLTEQSYPLTDTYLSKDNTPESIFEIQYIYDATGIKKNSGIANYMTPSTTAGTGIFDGVSIPFIGTTASISGSAFPTDYFINLFTKISAGLDPKYNRMDPRREIILGYGYDGNIFNRVLRGEKPWFGIKFWCPNMINTADGHNPRVFRYADAVLMLAECYNEIGEQSDALELLEEVRTRAGYTTFFSSTDYKQIQQEIREERARELMGDFQRRFDLVRWGIFYDQVRSNADIPLIRNNIKPYHKYLPIPDTEVLRTNGVLTNDEYQ